MRKALVLEHQSSKGLNTQEGGAHVLKAQNHNRECAVGLFQSLCWKQIFIFQEFISRGFHCKLNCRRFSGVFDTVV